ncbi:MAG: hypothetical protein LBP59_06220 [Planctomycetaceae bacterium]|nr:hypothetical protein [Planctomycetaceae bacterium]
MKNTNARSCLPVIFAMAVASIPIILWDTIMTLRRSQDYTWESWRYTVYALIVLCLLIIFLAYVNYKNDKYGK